ncbi:MAG: NTP transferase domain-containing protein [Planctomycetes bacterium]|nr:NTP transferase domain-containing protein [Planctomycetota bacterium]
MANRPNPERPDWTLGLLMGGASRRMGRDKAQLPFQGATLAEAVCAACRPESGQVLLAVGRPDRPVPAGLAAYPRIYDRRHGRGPLAAIEVLLESCLSPWLVVVPCDMVGLRRGDLERLLDAALAGSAGLACFDGDPRPQTFPLVLEVAALRGRCAPLFEEGKGRVLDLATLGCGLLRVPPALLGDPVEAAARLVNLNDDEAYRRLVVGADERPEEAS